MQGGGLDLYDIAHAGPITSTALFGGIGSALGGRAPRWAASGNRWAPENLEIHVASRWHNFIFVADDSQSWLGLGILKTIPSELLGAVLPHTRRLQS